MNFVKAIKGEPLKGWARLRIKEYDLLLEKEHPEKALPWIGEVIAKQFTWDENLVLCPMPDSECTIDKIRCSNVYPLVQSIASHLPNGIWDGLRWKHEMQKSRQGGPRDPETLFANLAISIPVPTDKKIVIIDDVCTSGGHIRAAEARIRETGGQARAAICAARTTLDQLHPALGLVTEELPEYNPCGP